MSTFRYCTLLLSLQVIGIFGYKPVIIIHGILHGPSDLNELKEFIEKAHPGTPVHIIDLFNYYNSFEPMWYQVDTIRNATSHIMETAKNGVHVIGYSQGGLIARGIIQTTDFHNVASFIALSSPLNGQYGNTYIFSWLFPHFIKEELSKLFYTTYGQTWSIGNYWKDPHEFDRYSQFSDFLAQLNNEAKADRSLFKDSWKQNFARLRQLVVIGGPDDGVITPWQSAQFGCYDEQESVMPMREMKLYHDDNFGLRTLDNSRSIMTCTFGGIKHLEWHKNLEVFNKCIKPYLN